MIVQEGTPTSYGMEDVLRAHELCIRSQTTLHASLKGIFGK